MGLDHKTRRTVRRARQCLPFRPHAGLLQTRFLTCHLLRVTIIIVLSNSDDAKDAQMYVCLCNAYRESELRQAASGGITCAKKAYAALGNGPNCGRCLDFAQLIIDEVHRTGPGSRAAAG